MNDPNAARTAATLRDFRSAWADVGLARIAPPPDGETLLESARDDAEIRALSSLGPQRRRQMGRMLHHIAAGADHLEAKRLAAADCDTSVAAITETIAHLRRAAGRDS